mmetsp:Transcript_2125/g.2976  ORF Transcript_2125/g.2976 Transcript_2125/m.2976 type:complete len:298 (-) Transcript_2125:190-1083(-)
MGSSLSSASKLTKTESRSMEFNNTVEEQQQRNQSEQSRLRDTEMKSFGAVFGFPASSSLLQNKSQKFNGLQITRQPIQHTEQQTKIRNQVVKLIENRLNRQQNNESDDNSKLQTQKLAVSLERHMYRTAPTWDYYADMTTFETRLRFITCRVMKRRERKKQGDTPRLEVLQNVLGFGKYQEATNLVNEVRAIRFKRACFGCQGSACVLQNPTNLKAIPGNQEMPVAIRALFFDLKLVDAYEKANVDTLSKLDWDSMIQAAQNNIQEYKAWQKEKLSQTSISVQTPVVSKRVSFVQND